MFVRFTHLSDGPGPSEVFVAVQTVEGRREEVVISKRQAQTGFIDVGAPIAADDGNFLVELPRESVSGAWRVWVSEAEVTSSVSVAAE